MRKMKLNNKGFTLVELLAVIVILAILAVVTIPTVLGSLKTARQETFNTAANTAADWFEKQYGLSLLGQADASFTTLCGANGGSCATAAKALTADALKAAGLNNKDYNVTSTVKIDSTTGRACVVLNNTTSGQFKDVTSPAKSSTCS